jgi:ankyrin repeat protein/beta-lactamase regulating signal transducer with metallopeptidase domain
MESWLTQITDYLLAQSWQIALLAIVIAVISTLLRNRSAHIRYILWLIVLAKCIVPPMYSIPVAVLPNAPLIAESMITNYRVPEADLTESAGSIPVQPKVSSSRSVIKRLASYGTRVWLAIGWFIGIIALSLYYLVNALRTQIWLQTRRKSLPSKYKENIESLFITHGVRRMPRIWLLDRISQPFVWGLVRGSIYLPAEMVDKKHTKFHTSLLDHELSHVIRFDALINSLQLIAQAIFWFHPFVWWTNRKIRAEREKCCDEMTIARSNALPEEYSEAIVEILVAKYKQARPVPSLAVAGHVKNIEERIKTMLRPGKKFYKRTSLVAAIIVISLALLTVPIGCVLTKRVETETAIDDIYNLCVSLYEAVKDGDIEQVKYFLSKGADADAGGYFDHTPLQIALSMGNNKIAELLIVNGANVNVENQGDGHAPLHIAAGQGYTEIVELLIDHGADVNKEWLFGTHPLVITEEHIIDGQPVFPDPNTSTGRTALFFAVYNDHKPIAELLLDNGADINKKDNLSGESPLLGIVNSSKSRDLIEFLITKGADVNAKNKYGQSSLHYAVSRGLKDITELLITEGANINEKDNEGKTALSLAKEKNNIEMVELLRKHGAKE